MWVRHLLPPILVVGSLMSGCAADLPDGDGVTGPCETQHLRITSVHLPRTGGEAALIGFDLDGDRVVDNQLGALNASLHAVYDAWDAEMWLSDRLAEREVQWLAMVERCEDARAWSARLARGADADGDGRPEIVDDGVPASGDGTAAEGGVGLVPVGYFADGAGMADDAAWEDGLAFTVSARASAGGDVTLTIGAAVELGDAALAPAARFLTDELARGSLFAKTVDMNRDGTVTVAELRASPAISTLLGADVDTDDDGVADRLSIGFSVEAESVITE
jgi:hypothetical protein